MKKLLFLIITILLATFVAAENWELTIEATNQKEPTTIGMHIGATDDYDPDFDEFTVPSSPDEKVIIYLYGGVYAKQIKALEYPDNWTLEIGVPTGQTTQLSWDTTALPATLNLTLENDTISLNMNDVTSLDLGEGTHEFLIKAEEQEITLVENIIITEIMPNPLAVGDADGEWVELYNNNDFDVVLDNWKIKDDGSNEHTITSLTIPAQSYIVLCKNSNSAENGGVTCNYEYGADMSLTNSIDEVILVDGDNEVDRVNFNSTFPYGSGVSMELTDIALDNNLNTSWKAAKLIYGDGDKGTPGLAYTGNTAPDQPILNKPEDGEFISSTTVELNFTATDNEQDPLTCNVYVQKLGETAEPIVLADKHGDVLYEWASTDDGEYEWKVQCNDGEADSLNSTTKTFIVDTTEPLIKDLNISPANIYNNVDVTLEANVTDDNLEDVWVSINLDGENWTNYTTGGVDDIYGYILTNDKLENQQTVLYKWYARDSAWNIAESPEQSFTVENRDPVEGPQLNKVEWQEDMNDTAYLVSIFTDPDGDKLTYSVEVEPEDIDYELNSTTGEIKLIPPADYTGNNTIQFRAEDPYGGFNISQETLLVVNNVNDAPTTTAIENRSVMQGNEVSIDVSNYVEDIDPDDTLTYATLTGSVGNMEINRTSGEFTWTPDHTNYGNYEITFLVDDATEFVTLDANIEVYSTLNITEVEVNNADVEEGETIIAKPGDEITTEVTIYNEGSVLIENIQTTLDTPGQIGYNGAVAEQYITAGDSEIVEFTFTIPSIINEGIYEVDILTAGEDYPDNFPRSSAFNYNINITKDLEDIVIEDLQLDNSTPQCDDKVAIEFKLTNRGSEAFNDVNLTVKSEELGFFHNEDNINIGSGSLYHVILNSVDVDNIEAGTYTIDVEIKYHHDIKSASNSVDVTILNCPPDFTGTINTITIEEDNASDVLNLTEYFTDLNNDSLTYAVQGNLTGLNFNSFATNGLVTITPNADFVGTNVINFTASDSTETAESNSLNVQVTNVNDRPIINAIGQQIAVEDVEFELQTNGGDIDPLDILTFNIYDLNTSLPGIDINETGYILGWTPTNSDVGNTYYAMVEFCDNSGADNDCANETFSILVTGENDAPEIYAHEDVEVDEDSLLQFTLQAEDIDDWDILSFSCNLTELSREVIDNRSANFTWTPTQEDVGTYSVNCTVTDLAGASNSTVFQIEVISVNDTPVLSSIADQSIPEKEPFSLQLTATDEEEDTLTYSITQSQTGDMAVDANGLFTWTPQTAGEYNITIEVTDGNSVDEENFSIIVHEGLIIKNVYLVDDGEQKALTDDGELSGVLPGSDLQLKLVLENKFKTFTIYDIAIDAELQGTSLLDGETVFELAAGSSTSTLTLDLGTLPEDTNANLNLAITAEGDYDSSTVQADFNTNVRVNSTRYMIVLQDAALTQDNISCDRSTTLSVDVYNIGSKQKDENVTVNVANVALGINTDSVSKIVTYGSDETYTIDLTVSQSKTSGTYPLTLTATSLRGTTDTTTINLIVSDCSVTVSPKEEIVVIAEDEQKLFEINGLANLNNPITTWTTEDGSQLQQGSYNFVPDTFDGNRKTYNIGVDVSDDNGFSLTNDWTVIATKVPYTEVFSTNFMSYNSTTITNVTNLVIERSGYGKVEFKGPLDLSDCVKIDDIVKIERGIIAINPVGGCSDLNEQNAKVTLTGLSFSGDPEVKYTATFTTNASDINHACTNCNASGSSTVEFYAYYGFSSYKVDGVTPDPEDPPVEPEEPGEGAIGNLTITDLDIKVGSKTDKNLDNGDKISDEAAPGDKVVLDLEIKNNGDLDVEDIKVEVTIDEGEIDIDEEEEIDKIKDGKKESIEIEFEIPEKVDEDTYTIEIHIEGDDDDDNTHEIDWTLEIEVDKEKHKVAITDIDLSPSRVSCSRVIGLDVETMNIGTETEEDVELEVKSSELDIDEEKIFDLDEDIDDDDNEHNSRFTLVVDDKVKAGTYPISIEVEYDDGDEVESEIAYLTVEDCKTSIDFDEEEEDEETIDVQILPGDTIKPTTPTTRKPKAEASFRDSTEYLVLLAIIVIMLIGAIIFVIGAVIITSKRR